MLWFSCQFIFEVFQNVGFNLWPVLDPRLVNEPEEVAVRDGAKIMILVFAKWEQGFISVNNLGRLLPFAVAL